MQPLPPGSTIGILGGGQLGRMLALAAARLGFKCHIYNDATGPACDVAARRNARRASTTRRSLQASRAPSTSSPTSSRTCRSRPPPRWSASRRCGRACKALQVSQDRLEEKRFVSGLGLPVAPFAAIAERAGFRSGAARRAIARDPEDAAPRLRRQGAGPRCEPQPSCRPHSPRSARARPRSRPWSTSNARSRSCSCAASTARRASTTSRVNRHEGGILRTSTVPCDLPAAHQARAREIAAGHRRRPSTTSACWRWRCSTSGAAPSR